MTERISIVIVDDHPIFRNGVKQALLLEPGFEVVGEADSAADAGNLVQRTQPDVLLLDAWMSDSGIERVPDLLAACPALRIIVLSASSDEKDVSRAMEIGASGYILKGTTAQNLHRVIREVHAGGTFVDTSLLGGLWRSLGNARRNEQSTQQLGLSNQETKALRLLSKGMSNKEIARVLEVSEKTVKYHLSNVFLKLGVRNRVEATIRARELWDTLDDATDAHHPKQPGGNA